MADEAALAFQPGGSPSAVTAEREAPSPPAGEPLRKRPRRDGPGVGRSPGEPGGAAPERELPVAAGGCPAAAALWREAQAAAAGEGDNGTGLQGLSREAPRADDFYDDDDDEGEEEEEAAAAIGYRGAQGAGGPGLRIPPSSSRGPSWGGGVSGGLGARGWLCGVPLPARALLSCAPPRLRARLPERPEDSLPPSSLGPRRAPVASRFAQPRGGLASQLVLKKSFSLLLLF